MSKIYFTADTHFGQERTLNLSKRPFKSVKEMDLNMLINWNITVKPGDTVYHLGDFGKMDIRPLLNGNIILVKGNYERNTDLLNSNEHYFKEIYDYTHEIQYDYNNTLYNITMTHEPSRVKDKVVTKTDLVVFGHVHKLCMIKKYGLCVSTDAHNFTPVSLDDVLFYHNSILTYYDNDVFY